MVSYYSNSHAIAQMAIEGSTPVPAYTMPKQMDIVNVPFEYATIRELDLDVGDGLSCLAFLFTKSDPMQTGAQILVSSSPDQGFAVIASFYSFSLHGVLTFPYPASPFHYDKDVGLHIAGASDDTEFGPISNSDLFTQPPVRFLCIDDEIMGFGGAEPTGTDGYYITKVLRGMFNTPVQHHAEGSLVVGGLTALCTHHFSGTGTFYFKIVPMNYLGHPMNAADISPIKMIISDKSRVPLRPARLEALRIGNTISLSWIPRVRGYGGAGNLSPEISVDLDPPYFTGHFAYSVNDAPKRLQMEPCLDVSVIGAAVVRVWQRDDGLESAPITLLVADKDGTYHTN